MYVHTAEAHPVVASMITALVLEKYQAVFNDGETVLNTSFIKDDGY